MAFQEIAEGQLARNTSFLTKHKVLPRRMPGQYIDHSYLYSPSASSVESEGSNSSTPVLRNSLIPDLPPTPPSNRNSGSVTAPLQLNESNTITPPPHRSPPTPDNTPPQHVHSGQRLKIPQNLRHAVSTTDSFRTAMEDQVVSDVESSSIASCRSKRRNNVIRSVNQTREIGLGLGLESEDDVTLPRSPERTDMVSFDGNWGQDLIEVSRNEVKSEQECEVNFMRNVSIRKKRRRRKISPPSNRSSQEMDFQYSGGLLRGPSLRERIESKKGSAASASTEDFALSIDWPRDRGEELMGLDVFDADVRRFSGLSSSSTIVREAIVVDTTPKRQRTLRHTRKNVELRREASRGGFPEVSSRSRSDRRHSSFADSPTREDNPARADEELELGHVSQEVVPERQSSLRRKAAFTLDRRVRSQSSATGKRPEGDRDAYSDRLKTNRRTVSETNRKYDDRRTADFPPKIPQRSSSLSAPTSRANSRAASMTSASVHSRPIEVGQLSTQQPPEVVSSSEQIQESLAVQPVFTHVTPFSVPSSTPEALEVSQARAVNFYPHTNHSVNLVIQTNSRPTTSKEAGSSSPLIPSTPTLQAVEGLSEVDSPLKNPRRPPEPPLFMVIPPTPANASSPPKGSLDVPVNTKSVPERSDSRKPLARVRRALSQRSHSDSFVRPFSQLRSFSSIRGKNRRNQINVVEAKATTLHPLWRPRAFWEGFDDESEGEYVLNEDFLDRGWTPWLDNSPTTVERRLSQSEGRVRESVDYAPSRRPAWIRRLSFHEDPRQFTRNQKHIPIGLRGWNSVQSHVRELKERRTKRGLEQKRDTIRETISGPKPAQPETYRPGWEVL